MNSNIDFLYVDSGGGHRAAASALLDVVRQQQRPWNTRMLSVQDLLDEIDFIRKSTGIEFQEIYNIILRRGWTAITPPLVPLAHSLIWATHSAQVRVIEKYWKQNPPDMVVSLIPHYNRAFFQALARVNPAAPYVTVITDLADYPPNFWIERQDQYVVCPTPHAALQARQTGLAERYILRASGVVLSPKFYAAAPADRAAERIRLGLKPDLPTGMILFGGQGSTEIERIARRLDRSKLDVQLIAMCGRNQRVAATLRRLSTRIPIHVEGFTSEIPHFMSLCDFFIGKPGPGCISEALAMKLPVIVERNANTLPQERFNTHWVEDQGVGVVVKSFAQIAAAVRVMLNPVRYAAYRQAADALRNSAVFEIPEMLEQALADSRKSSRLAS
jgi:1,2-diacylglycerol 3-beta-galactosyltransferase